MSTHFRTNMSILVASDVYALFNIQVEKSTTRFGYTMCKKHPIWYRTTSLTHSFCMVKLWFLLGLHPSLKSYQTSHLVKSISIISKVSPRYQIRPLNWLLPKVPVFNCQKMALRVPEQKNGDYFLIVTSPQNGD